MNKEFQYFRDHNLVPQRFTIYKNIKFIECDNQKFVIKRRRRSDKNLIYQYLLSRNFDYFPQPFNQIDKDEYEIYPFIEEIQTPIEQKALDLIYFISLLHNKTTFYKEIDLDEIKAFYEKTLSELTYLENYYYDLQNMIENQIYMSPSEYLLIRNVSKIYAAIHFCKQELNNWYNLIIKKKKQRFVMAHHNMSLDHFIKGERSCFISWDKAEIDLPIYDLLTFYQKHYDDFDFLSLIQAYENKYPLLEEEKCLLFVLISIPKKITLEKNEFEKCKEISKFIYYLNKTSDFISKQNSCQANE